MEIHELLLLKYDGAAERFPVLLGEPDSLEQAKLRASLSQHPGDILVLVTEDAYIRAPRVASEQAASRR